MLWIVLIKADGKIYIMAQNNKTYAIQAFETQKEALKYFEDVYNEAHNRDYESSMSACINHIHFQPSVIEVNDINDITDNIASEEPKPVSMHSVSGNMVGITTRPEADKLWESGAKPKLIEMKESIK